MHIMKPENPERGILHGDISMGNVMHIGKPQIPEQENVEPLAFAKYLLGEGSEGYVSRC